MSQVDAPSSDPTKSLIHKEVDKVWQHSQTGKLLFPYQLKCWIQTLTSCGHWSYPHQTLTMQVDPFRLHQR